MTTIKAGKVRGNRKQRTIVRLENWAEGCGTVLQPISVQRTRSADYKATFPDDESTTIIIEVKEMRFDFEVDLTEGSPVIELLETGSGEGRFRSADRVRNKIKRAAKQLQPYAEQDLPFPDPFLGILGEIVNQVDAVRTPEAHGAGLLRKWTLANLPLDRSRDFGLMNH